LSDLHTRPDWPTIESALHEATLAVVAARHHTTPGALAAAWRAVHTATDAGAELAFASGDELPPEPGERALSPAPSASAPARVAWQIVHGPPGSRQVAVVVAATASEALEVAAEAGVQPSSVARIGEVDG